MQPTRPFRRFGISPVRALASFAILTCALALAAAIPTISSGQWDIIRIEAESFTFSHNQAGDQIVLKNCAGHDASGGWAVDGMDSDGDYLEFEIELLRPYCFRDSLCSAGTLGTVRTFVVDFFHYDDPETVYSDTLQTQPGLGFS